MFDKLRFSTFLTGDKIKYLSVSSPADFEHEHQFLENFDIKITHRGDDITLNSI